MAKYEVEYAKFIKVQFEAETQEEANDIASMMDDEQIEDGTADEGYVIWNDPKEIKEKCDVCMKCFEYGGYGG